MPTDPSLILNFAQNLPNLAPDPSKLLAQQLSADRLTVFAQQQEGQKALKDLYANPQNLDQQGRPTPQAMSRLMAAAPTEGLDLTQALTRDSTATAQLALMRAKEGDETIKQRYQIGLAADTAYRQAIANKLPPEQARKAGQDAFTEARDAAAPFLGPDVMNTIPTNYDPSRVARGLSAYQQLVLGPKGQLEMAKTVAEIERDKAETLRAGQQAVSAQFTDPHNVTYIDKDGKQKTDTARYDRVSDQWIKDGKPLNVIKIGGTAGSGGPKAMAFTAYMQAHPDATPEQQAEFIQSSGTMARSGPAAAVRKFMQENPDATAEQIAQFTADVGREISASRAFGTGKQADIVRSFNALSNHMPTLQRLGDALQNGDVRAINALRNTVKTEFGIDAPIDFDLAKKLVGNEVVKSVLGSSAGSLTDRQDIQSAWSKANSPAQLLGVLRDVQAFGTGQVDALRRQYQTSTGRTDFDHMLSPNARTLFGGAPETAKDEKSSATPQAAPVGVPSRPAAVPPDAKLQHNPSTGAYRWLAPDGKAYDAQGAPM